MLNISLFFEFTVQQLKRLSIKHEIFHFPSGAILLDIWIEDKFYVFQFEEEFIGISEVNESNISFDTIPDETFFKTNEFKAKLKYILNPESHKND